MSDADADLVERARSGDRSAFEALVAEHLPRLRAIALSVVHQPATADDVVQEAFLKAWTRLGQLSDAKGFPAWIARIARNEAITVLRRGQHQRAVELAEAEHAAPVQEDPPDPRLAALREAMLGLKAEYREILALRYEANLDYVAMGMTLGISSANVEKRLYRARQALLAAMGPRDS
jgi:RNA polymerase sigma factor (sigma-70 family)